MMSISYRNKSKIIILKKNHFRKNHFINLERDESDEDEDSSPEAPPSQLKLANEPYYEEYPTPHSTQLQHDPGDANEAESQNGRPDNPRTSVSID